ncbi:MULTISPECIES: RNA-binding S4 domain-containing protein [Thiorhodovibrio]|uniref:RNA-binding S4 domain-containing protein n=1 Tax=Thiorhodovibrio TaxID=61593 RepID=UPI001913F368|nr:MULTISPECIES: S4 domain-containing protein [Thiorhodovibrio]MBK5970662.1 RNA-binding protein S4 [Thiorhodovibrio winogradskyi]WPL14204.1 Heat shock protein 15 [Thiorhodovibrio litoralis]
MSAATDANEASQRLDKWLWAARFFKTRQLAVDAVNGGKVQVDGQRCKPSRALRPGARLHIQKGELAWEIEVRALSKQRRPASEAVLMYEEDEASRLRRQELARAARENVHLGPRTRGRPTKRDRRQLEAFNSRQKEAGSD